MSMREHARVIAAAATVAGMLIASIGTAAGEGPGLGRAATAEQVAAWDISIAPDGATLPAGSGTPAQGMAVYAAKCQSCHGDGGAGGEGLADPLVGGMGSLDGDKPMKTVGSYWPYATTLFDYTRRAMPLDAPMSLSDDEVYAVSAYVLSLNGIIGEADEMNAQTLPKVQMPNRAGFVNAWQP